MNQNVQGKGNANLRTHWPSCLHFSWLFAFLKVTKQGNLSWARAMETPEISKQNTNLSIWKSKGARAPVADGGKPCGPDRRPLSASAGLSLWCRCVSCICWSTLSDLPQLLRVSQATEMKFQNAPFQSTSHFAFIKNRKTCYLLCIPENPFTRRIITEPCFPLLCGFIQKLKSFWFHIPKLPGRGGVGAGVRDTEQSTVWKQVAPQSQRTLDSPQFQVLPVLL